MSKWRRTRITPDILKDFRYMYDCTNKQIHFSEGETQLVPVENIIPLNDDWHQTILRYNGLIGRIERKSTYKGSSWEQHEIHNETKNIRVRFDRFKRLYNSIKKHGYEYRKREPLILLNIIKLKRKKPLKGGRINWNYYRCNGMKRILICNYLGIKKIPCKIYHVRLG